MRSQPTQRQWTSRERPGGGARRRCSMNDEVGGGTQRRHAVGSAVAATKASTAFVARPRSLRRSRRGGQWRRLADRTVRTPIMSNDPRRARRVAARRDAMAEPDFALFDCDNHYYEALDAFTRHMDPRLAKRAVSWAEVDGRKRLLVAEKLNRFIPNPTFDPVSKPGALEKFFRGENPGGLDIRAAFGELEPIRPEYRDREARLARMDEQGLEASPSTPARAATASTPSTGVRRRISRPSRARRSARSRRPTAPSTTRWRPSSSTASSTASRTCASAPSSTARTGWRASSRSSARPSA